MLAHERLGFQADRAITERRALRAAADNADMLSCQEINLLQKAQFFLHRQK